MLGIAPSTLHKYLRVVRKYYRDQVREGLISPQAPYPFTGIMPKQSPTVKEALTRQEIERFRGLRVAPGTMRYHPRPETVAKNRAANIVLP